MTAGTTAAPGAAAPITGVDAAAYTVPTDAPEADGTYTWDATTMVVATVEAGGQSGMGFSYAPAPGAALVSTLLADAVHGIDAFDIPAAAAAMADATRNAGHTGLASYLVSAVDCALWDLKSRLLGIPLVSLLGEVHHAVALYGSGGFTTYDETRLREQLGGWAHGQGIPRVKIKIGQDNGRAVPRDLLRIAQAREAIGDAAELFIDANGAYTAAQAIRVAGAAAAQDVTWFEEPVSSDDLAGLREVRRAITADVAAGEYGTDIHYFRRMCQADAVDCLQIDVTRCGGISAWQRAAAVAASFNLQVSAHCAPHMSVAAAAATPNFRHLEWFHDHVRIEGMLFDGTLDPQGGVLHPADTPGNGLALRTADAEPFRVA
jgi:L-alanine-DL-glutamate epimerase-like enolase superfamily enzyme